MDRFSSDLSAGWKRNLRGWKRKEGEPRASFSLYNASSSSPRRPSLVARDATRDASSPPRGVSFSPKKAVSEKDRLLQDAAQRKLTSLQDSHLSLVLRWLQALRILGENVPLSAFKDILQESEKYSKLLESLETFSLASQSLAFIENRSPSSPSSSWSSSSWSLSSSPLTPENIKDPFHFKWTTLAAKRCRFLFLKFERANFLSAIFPFINWV